jgi:malonyl-CoA O-methyltransferase
MSSQRPPTIDAQAARHWQRLPSEPSPWLHEEVARRMEERLAWIKLQPKNWAHWEPVRGGLQAQALLARRYPDAACFMVEADAMKAQYAAKITSKPWWQASRWTAKPTRFEMPAEGAVQMLWANMALHMAADPLALMAQWHHALAVDGFLMFSCLGPDTLQELRALYQTLGWPTPTHEFTDMHDWGDMLAGVGFAEPVMDMERIVLTFESPERLLQELRGLGRNLQPQRFTGLRGRQWYQQLLEALSQAPLQLTFEVIYGHAFKPAPKLTVSAHSEISLPDMRAALARGKNIPNGYP